MVAAVAAAAAEAKVAKWLQQPLMQLAGGQVAAATPGEKALIHELHDTQIQLADALAQQRCPRGYMYYD